MVMSSAAVFFPAISLQSPEQILSEWWVEQWYFLLASQGTGTSSASDCRDSRELRACVHIKRGPVETLAPSGDLWPPAQGASSLKARVWLVPAKEGADFLFMAKWAAGAENPSPPAAFFWMKVREAAKLSIFLGWRRVGSFCCC